MSRYRHNPCSIGRMRSRRSAETPTVSGTAIGSPCPKASIVLQNSSKYVQVNNFLNLFSFFFCGMSGFATAISAKRVSLKKSVSV